MHRMLEAYACKQGCRTPPTSVLDLIRHTLRTLLATGTLCSFFCVTFDTHT